MTFIVREHHGRMIKDGQTKLKLIIEDVQATKVVDAHVYCKQIQSARLGKYQHSVKKAMEAIIRCYNSENVGCGKGLTWEKAHGTITTDDMTWLVDGMKNNTIT